MVEITPQWIQRPFVKAKLVGIVVARILDVVVDIRKGSLSYDRHVAVELSAANWLQLAQNMSAVNVRDESWPSLEEFRSGFTYAVS